MDIVYLRLRFEIKMQAAWNQWATATVASGLQPAAGLAPQYGAVQAMTVPTPVPMNPAAQATPVSQPNLGYSYYAATPGATPAVSAMPQMASLPTYTAEQWALLTPEQQTWHMTQWHQQQQYYAQWQQQATQLQQQAQAAQQPPPQAQQQPALPTHQPLYPPQPVSQPPLPTTDAAGPPLPEDKKRALDDKSTGDVGGKKLKTDDKSGTGKSETLEDLLELRKSFDTQFSNWENEYFKWKEANANHPDQAQKKEYETKWSQWREQLLHKRDAIDKKINDKKKVLEDEVKRKKQEEIAWNNAFSALQNKPPGGPSATNWLGNAIIPTSSANQPLQFLNKNSSGTIPGLGDNSGKGSEASTKTPVGIGGPADNTKPLWSSDNAPFNFPPPNPNVVASVGGGGIPSSTPGLGTVAGATPGLTPGQINPYAAAGTNPFGVPVPGQHQFSLMGLQGMSVLPPGYNPMIPYQYPGAPQQQLASFQQPNSSGMFGQQPNDASGQIQPPQLNSQFGGAQSSMFPNTTPAQVQPNGAQMNVPNFVNSQQQQQQPPSGAKIQQETRGPENSFNQFGTSDPTKAGPSGPRRDRVSRFNDINENVSDDSHSRYGAPPNEQQHASRFRSGGGPNDNARFGSGGGPPNNDNGSSRFGATDNRFGGDGGKEPPSSSLNSRFKPNVSMYADKYAKKYEEDDETEFENYHNRFTAEDRVDQDESKSNNWSSRGGPSNTGPPPRFFERDSQSRFGGSNDNNRMSSAPGFGGAQSSFGSRDGFNHNGPPNMMNSRFGGGGNNSGGPMSNDTTGNRFRNDNNKSEPSPGGGGLPSLMSINVGHHGMSGGHYQPNDRGTPLSSFQQQNHATEINKGNRSQRSRWGAVNDGGEDLDREMPSKMDTPSSMGGKDEQSSADGTAAPRTCVVIEYNHTKTPYAMSIQLVKGYNEQYKGPVHVYEYSHGANKQEFFRERAGSFKLNIGRKGSPLSNRNNSPTKNSSNAVITIGESEEDNERNYRKSERVDKYRDRLENFRLEVENVNNRHGGKDRRRRFANEHDDRDDELLKNHRVDRARFSNEHDDRERSPMNDSRIRSRLDRDAGSPYDSRTKTHRVDRDRMYNENDDRDRTPINDSRGRKSRSERFDKEENRKKEFRHDDPYNRKENRFERIDLNHRFDSNNRTDALSTLKDDHLTNKNVLHKKIAIEDILDMPGRAARPPKIVVFLRGPPGSGKSYLAKIIKEKETEFDSNNNLRILSLDDYFITKEVDKEIVDERGVKKKMKCLEYEYDEELEDVYRTNLIKSFKTNIKNAYFNFLIVDSNNDRVKYYEEMYAYAEDHDYVNYVIELTHRDLGFCLSNNVHKRSEEDIVGVIDTFEPTPTHQMLLDVSGLLQSIEIDDVQMEDVEESMSGQGEIQEVEMGEPSEDDDDEEEDVNESETKFTISSKWDNIDNVDDFKAKLDGVNRKLGGGGGGGATRQEQKNLSDWLSSENEELNLYKGRQDGQKHVRWADIEEKFEQDKMKAIGFIVGQTDWNRMLDPNSGEKRMNQTKYI